MGRRRKRKASVVDLVQVREDRTMARAELALDVYGDLAGYERLRRQADNVRFDALDAIPAVRELRHQSGHEPDGIYYNIRCPLCP